MPPPIAPIWIIDRVEQMDVELLLPDARNARTHSDDQVTAIARSIEHFGFLMPVLVTSERRIIAGHGRTLAAGKIGKARLPKIPVVVDDHLSEEQRRAFMIADNQLAEMAGWDEAKLTEEMRHLEGLGFDTSLLGFSASELEGFRPHPDDDRANETPELPELPASRPGDLWVLGSNRVQCGDSLSPADVARVLAPAGMRLMMMVTDPPYGVEYDPTWRDEINRGTTTMTGKVKNDDTVDWTPAWKLFPGDVAYVWHAGIYAGEVAKSLFDADFRIRGQIIWKKQNMVLSRGAYHWQHEPCWYGVRKGKAAHWRGDRSQTTVWEVANLNPVGGNKTEEKTGHGTQKPVEIMRRPILNHTVPGEYVYDPFLGSGSTLIAAQSVQRHCVGSEIDPRYVDQIVMRWEKYTGQVATLDGDGRTFTEVRAERLAPTPAPAAEAVGA